MSTQFYKIELTVEIEAVDKIKFRQVKDLSESQVYAIDVTPLDVEDNQFIWLKEMQSQRVKKRTDRSRLWIK
jgi:hypothetical protein|tara:strand:- start:133 stop:348 length:216 start_codon:yes stop_codon:yes gene_type:complete